MEIIKLLTGPIGTNTYIVYKEEGTPEAPAPAVCIDPADAKPVLRALKNHGLHLTDILLTHGHFDHILGVRELRDAEGAKVYIHPLDAPALETGEGSLSVMCGIRPVTCPADKLLRDGEEFTAAGITFRCIHTPGHTPGGVCFVADGENDKRGLPVIFSGDTLFCFSIGRTDLPGGSTEDLIDSIAFRLFTLHGDYTVYPGHNMTTTLDAERQHNPYVK